MTAPEHVIHGLSEAVRDAVPFDADVLACLLAATGAAVIGLAAGAVTALVVAVGGAPFRKAKPGH